MSFFSTTSHLTHRTPLPSTASKAIATSLLRDHDYIIKLDPEFESYTSDPAPTSPPPSDPTTKYYTISDHMEALPRGLWDTTVKFKCEITDVEDGVKRIILAPMGLVQVSLWKLVEEEEGLFLVEDVDITCSRLLMGTVKGKCEQGWRGIHAKFAERLAAISQEPKDSPVVANVSQETNGSAEIK